jgi:hypothetical protein
MVNVSKSRYKLPSSNQGWNEARSFASCGSALGSVEVIFENELVNN